MQLQLHERIETKRSKHMIRKRIPRPVSPRGLFKVILLLSDNGILDFARDTEFKVMCKGQETVKTTIFEHCHRQREEGEEQ